MFWKYLVMQLIIIIIINIWLQPFCNCAQNAKISKVWLYCKYISFIKTKSGVAYQAAFKVENLPRDSLSKATTRLLLGFVSSRAHVRETYTTRIHFTSLFESLLNEFRLRRRFWDQRPISTLANIVPGVASSVLRTLVDDRAKLSPWRPARRTLADSDWLEASRAPR